MTDDSSLNLPNQTALTSDLMYNLKPSATRSRNYRASILPTNKTVFAPSDTTIVYFPGGRRATYLDCSQSYMRFTVKNTDGTNFMNFDTCAATLINRIDIFHGSNLLETITNYNILAAYIFDVQSSQSSKIGLANSLRGFGIGVMPYLGSELVKLKFPVYLITGGLDEKFT